MSRHVSVPEAMLHLSRLVEEVKAGGEIILTKSGKPCARLVPLEPAPRDLLYEPPPPPELALPGQIFEDWDLQT